MNPRNPKLALALALLCLASLAAVGGPWAAAGLDDPNVESVYGWMSQGQVARFDAFQLYWLGASFDGLDLYAAVREVEPALPGERHGRDTVDFLYGHCDASAGSCPFPLSVQVWPACLRNLSSYELAPGTPYPYVETRIRGVPAATFDGFDGGGRIELYTGNVTVVIFGDGEERRLQAAQALESTGDVPGLGRVAAGERLPSPAPGALTGAVRCDGG